MFLQYVSLIIVAFLRTDFSRELLVDPSAALAAERVNQKHLLDIGSNLSISGFDPMTSRTKSYGADI